MASVRFPNSQEICRNRNHPIAGRSPQMLECNSCLFYVHRTCLPGKGISSTEYVRLKKKKEAFHFKCNPCSNVEEFVHLGIGNGRDIDQPVASSSSVEADVDQPPASSSRGRGSPRAVVADVCDQPPASSSRGRGLGRGRNVETPPDSMPEIDQPASYSSRGRGSHTVPPVTTIASLTVNIVLPVSASSPMEDLPLELPIAMNFTCPQDLISPL
ncbi:uncharacterized protein LOC124346476 [Daphnia pulicaria]|uniref:uncharacterized protein LOC124346476 n=1 Tax=Daphnia pulicaria TaxID=35523 RepID=UPI001EEA78D0|nr:uncharacterized protein LOC124346476 [Daphnia pulicaria]